MDKDCLDAFDEGCEAALSGKSETDNPYSTDLQFDDHLSWNDGFRSVNEEDDDET